MIIDRKFCEAILALRHTAAFEHLITVFREDAVDAIRTLSSAEGTLLFRAQGKYQTLSQFLDAVDKARENLDRFDRK